VEHETRSNKGCDRAKGSFAGLSVEISLRVRANVPARARPRPRSPTILGASSLSAKRCRQVDFFGR